MNGITELHIFYIWISVLAIAFIFIMLNGPVLRIFKRFVP